jgi:hypothetical protein
MIIRTHRDHEAHDEAPESGSKARKTPSAPGNPESATRRPGVLGKENSGAGVPAFNISIIILPRLSGSYLVRVQQPRHLMMISDFSAFECLLQAEIAMRANARDQMPAGCAAGRR